MKKLSNYVVTRKYEDGKVMLNTKNNFSIKVTKALLNKISNDEKVACEFEDYLAQNRFYEEENEYTNMMKQIFSEEDELLRLTILTHGDCNFRCLYCYEQFENVPMSQQTMDNIVKFTEEKLKNGNYKILRASWFGGEPLLGYKTILYLSDKFQELAIQYDVEFIADMTTNGYLLDKRKFQVLVEKCKCTTYQITIDGTKESHDQQRVMKNGKGTFERIYNNLLEAKASLLDFVIILRFNISKVNFNQVQGFMDLEGIPFKTDARFYFMYRNVENWGQGQRTEKYSIEMLKSDVGYQFSNEAIEKGYKIYEVLPFLKNSNACYATNPNNYTFDVRGKIMACTVLLYNSMNIFGNVNIDTLDEQKRRKLWIHSIEKIPKDCRNCEIVAICKGGYCPKIILKDHATQERVCQRAKESFEKSLNLFVRQDWVEVTLDV